MFTRRLRKLAVKMALMQEKLRRNRQEALFPLPRFVCTSQEATATRVPDVLSAMTRRPKNPRRAPPHLVTSEQMASSDKSEAVVMTVIQILVTKGAGAL